MKEKKIISVTKARDKIKKGKSENKSIANNQLSFSDLRMGDCK